MSFLLNKRQRDNITLSSSSINENCGLISTNYQIGVTRFKLADRINALTDKDFEIGTISQIKIKCAFCNKDILRDLKIICIQCDDQPLFCFNCLLKCLKRNNESHLHDYHVFDRMEFPMFTIKWSIREEMKLLFAIEKNGLDNWEDIADNIKTKTKEECEAHYYSFYYQNSKIKIPLMKDIILKKSMISGRPGDFPKIVIDENIKKDNEAKENKSLQEVLKNRGTIPQETINKQNIFKGKRNNSNFEKGQKMLNTNNTVVVDENKIIGYYPKRLEFDIEYLNDAELDICELEFYDEDTEEDKDLKLRMLQLYNQEIDEREKRKRFVIERKLFDVKSQIKMESKLPKEEREIFNCLKPFARYLSPPQFNELFEGIILEKHLRQRISKLQRYKDKGCSTYEEMVEAENEENKNKHGSQKDNVNVMLAETCGIGNKLKTFLIKSSNEIEDNNIEREKEFINRIGISKTNYKEIKENISKCFFEKRIHKEKEKKIKGNNLEKIVDFVLEYTLANHNKDQQEKNT